MIETVIVAALPLLVLLPLCILVEVLSPKPGHVLRGRFPGTLFVLFLPAALFLVAWPLSQLWKLIGVDPLFSLSGLHPAIAVVALIVIHDFLRYWEHRFEHRFWWPVHAVHHSVRDLHAANSYAHPFAAIPEFLIVTVPLSLIDMSIAEVPLAAAMLLTLQNLIIHSPIDVHLGPLRRLVVSSRFHRIHHSLEPRHFDRNFAITFSIWDRLFGTAHFPAKGEWPDVGVEGIDQPRTAIRYIAAPLANLTALKRESRRSGEPAQITADI